MASAWTPPRMLLEVAGDDQDLVTEMIQTYQSDVANRLDVIRGAMANSDTARLKYQVHAIKGSSQQMEAHLVANLCQQIEDELRERSVDHVRGLVKQLETRILEVCAAMAHYQK